jgi:hypothetical protein
VAEQYARQYINDIFGYAVGEHSHEGLVNCDSECDYEEKIEACCESWNEREKLARDTSVPVFYNWFKTNHSHLLKTKMLKPIRLRAGLGNPPMRYTSNDNESINSRVKQKVNYKASELHVFCEKFQEIIDLQIKNVKRAFTLGNGPYQVLPLYSDLQQNPRGWIKLPILSKEKYLKKIQLIDVRHSLQVSNADPTPSNSENIPPLSVSFDDSGLSETVYRSMWEKACKLFHNSLVSDIPGMPNGEIVASNSTPQKPHIVSVLQCGKFTCDCVNYKSKHLCSHVIASAESCGKLSSLLNWFSRTNQEPSLWKLSQSSGISKHPGSKPGQQHKRGKKSTSALPSKRTKFTIPSVSSTPSVIPAISECNVHVDHPPIITSVPSISVNSPITGPSISIASSTQPHMSFPAVPSISIVSPITAPSISIASTVMPSSTAYTASSLSRSHFSISVPDNSVLSNTSMPVNHIMSMSPFNAKFITDRIMKCQGCRKNFRSVSGSKLPPPLDLIVSRMERRPFVRPDGSVYIPTNHSNCMSLSSQYDLSDSRITRKYTTTVCCSR